MAITLHAKTVEGRSPTCRYERFGLVSTCGVLVPFPDSLRRRCLRECLAMKLRALRWPEVRLHVPPRHKDNKRVRFARVFFGRNRVFFLDATQDPETGLLYLYGSGAPPRRLEAQA